jgi:hypothetical protein
MPMIGWKDSEGRVGQLNLMNDLSGMGQEVVIVLSGELAPRLSQLAAHHHVWARRTVETEQVAQTFWHEHRPEEASASPGSITLFTGTGEAENDLLSMIDTVELHHGLASSEQPAATALRVLGAMPTAAIRGAIGMLGFTRIEPIPDGFVAHWHGARPLGRP